FLPLRRKHEVVDDELTAILEDIRERLGAVRAIEDVQLVDLLPRQLAPLPAQRITLMCEFFLLRQERRSRREPLVVRHHRMGHASTSALPWGEYLAIDPLSLLSFTWI